MSLKDWDKDKFKADYSRSLYNGIRKAAYKIGKEIVYRFRDDNLQDVKSARNKAIGFKVRRNNTLAIIDNGYDSRIREYGATIRATAGGALVVPFDGEEYREQKRRDKAKGRKQDTYLLVRPGKDPLVMLNEGDEARPIAVLKREVKREASHSQDKLSYISNDEMKRFDDMVADLVEKEMK